MKGLSKMEFYHLFKNKIWEKIVRAQNLFKSGGSSYIKKYYLGEAIQSHLSPLNHPCSYLHRIHDYLLKLLYTDREKTEKEY